MGEELSLNNATMYIDGKPMGNVTNISAKASELKKNHSFEFANRIMPGRLDIGLNRKLILQFAKKVQQTNKLAMILNKTRKLRVKKKLYHRIVKLWR